MKRVGQIIRGGVVNRIKDELNQNASIFVLSYSNLSGDKVNGLRMGLKKAGAGMYVSKNSIARLALTELNHADLAKRVLGQTAFVWSNEDSVEVAKILINFSKDLENVNVQGAVLENSVIDADAVKRLSDLPSREVLLATLLGTLQAPVSRLLSAMNAKSRDLLSILKQLSEKKSE